MPFSLLKEAFNMTDKGDFWKYLQLRSSVNSAFGLKLVRKENVMKDWLNSPSNAHSASVFYKKLLHKQEGLCDSLRLVWQRDLNIVLNEDVWSNIISDTSWATRDARSKFIHYKIVHRYYHTPSKMFKMGLLLNNNCWKCGSDTGTYLHVSWECPLVFPFWTEVITTLEKWTGLSVPKSPELCLLGDKSLMPPGFTKKMLGPVIAGFILAARLILRN